MKYRKKPVVIEAQLLTEDNKHEIAEWCNGLITTMFTPKTYFYINILTLEGTMRAYEGDYIIQGVKGEFYPCKADIFEATYEAIE